MRLAIAALAACLVTPAAAQSQCGPRDGIVAALADRYGETRAGIGLQSNGAIIELFASAETGTWTLLVTRPDGTSCAVSAGEAWQAQALETPGRDG